MVWERKRREYRSWDERLRRCAIIRGVYISPKGDFDCQKALHGLMPSFAGRSIANYTYSDPKAMRVSNFVFLISNRA